MRLLFGIFVAFSVAAAVGLGSTLLVLMRGTAFGAIELGAWTAWPRNGTSDIDPYARATLARSGELPIGSGDGVTFIAKADDDGKALDGRCDVVLTGITPQARFWTVTLYDSQGRLIANVIDRFGFTSQELVRRSDGSFEITVAPQARMGNWLPTGGVDRYLLMLRLYDTPVGVATRAAREAPMPAISMRACP